MEEMEYKKINKKNKQNMSRHINNSLNYEWEDDQLINELIKKFENIYPFPSDPKEFVNDTFYINKINNLFKLLFDRTIDNCLFLQKLEIVFNELLIKFPALQSQHRYDINFYKKIISKSNRLIIKGYGGIGKSYFVYKLEEKLCEINVDHVCIYGKYNKKIPNKLYYEIKNKKKDFYLIIDAINEFSEKEQQNIIDNLKKIKNNKNINIIVTYRTFSLDKNIVNLINKLLINECDFKGVDFQSSLLTLIEMYGVEAVRLIDVIESNNPLYITMLKQILSNAKIKGESVSGVVQMTFIIEKYIKNICTLDDWEFVKKIGNHMFINNKTSISNDELKVITAEKFESFKTKMIQNDFMSSYIYNGTLYFIFSMQRISDYVIARPLFEFINNKNEDEIINIVNEKLEKMHSIHEAFALVLLDKYKDKSIEKALNIIFKSDIGGDILHIFKKISFNDKQIKYIQENVKIDNLKKLFLLLGGYPNRPFNCKNYFNQILIDSVDIQKKMLVEYEEHEYIMHLKNIVYTLPFLEKEKDILEEYFYYAFWLMSVPVERIRNLATKIVHDISYKDNKFTNFLIGSYSLIEELYIKKGIVHVLTQLPKTKEITKFIEKLYYDKNELNAEIIHRTAVYLNKENEYQLLNKENLNRAIPQNTAMDMALDLKKFFAIADIYEKNLLFFKQNSRENGLYLNDNFMTNDNREIYNYNFNLQKKFSCIKNNGYCKYSIGDRMFKKHLEPIDISVISPERMLILFQEIFKEICKLYNYDHYGKEKFDLQFNKFGDSLLKKMLLLTQEILLGSLMTNYYTNEFSVYNDEKTLGYKSFTYITNDEEKIYLSSPVSPYNEVIDKLNKKLCAKLELYKNNNYRWYKNKKVSIMNCCKMTNPIIYDNNSWSLIGGNIHLFIPDFISVSYLCKMAFNPNEKLLGDNNSKYLTIENKKYFGSINNYIYEPYSKNMDIPNFEYSFLDVKRTNLSFPPPTLLKYLNLEYNFRTSSWDDAGGNQVILCDNNSKELYNYPISGAIYIKTDILDTLKKNNNIVYWCYTEKLYKNYGWNEAACLHLELDSNGNVVKQFKNNSLSNSSLQINAKCKNCKYNLYEERNKISSNQIKEYINNLMDEHE